MTLFREVSTTEKIYRTLLVVINVGWLFVSAFLFWASYWMNHADRKYKIAYRLMVDIDNRPIEYIFQAYGAVIICIVFQAVFGIVFEVASCLLSYICGVILVILVTTMLIILIWNTRRKLESLLSEGMIFCIDNFQ